MEIELAKSIIQKEYFVNGDQKIRTEHPIRVVDLAAMMEDYHQQRVKNNDSLDNVSTRFFNVSEALSFLNKDGHVFKERLMLDDKTIISIANQIFEHKYTP